jgi:phosphoenolpyruvate carboxylase
MVSKLNNNIKIMFNAKGHPTVGHLTVRKTLARQPKANPYLDKCETLEITSQLLSDLFEMKDYIDARAKMNSDHLDHWIKEVYRKLYNFVNRGMEPTFNDIDAMLLVCRVLLQHDMKRNIEEFILNCPRRFMLTYANNSEHTPAVLSKLDKLGLSNIRAYIMSFTHQSKLMTWNERRNAHKKGTLLLEHTV